MTVSKLTVISGHLGSGKTEFSLNYTTSLRRKNPDKKVVLCDLDFINPYFRSRRHAEILAEHGVTLITPEDREVSIADIPSISGKVRAALADLSADVIVELGGDANGAIVIGHLNRVIRERGFDHYMVVNLNRPDTDDSEKVLDMVRSIEKTSNLPVTELILNNHLMGETTCDVVFDGYEQAAAMGFSATPIKYVCIHEAFAEKANGRKLKENEEWFVMRRFLRYAHEAR